MLELNEGPISKVGNAGQDISCSNASDSKDAKVHAPLDCRISTCSIQVVVVLQCQPAFGAPSHHPRQTQGHIWCQPALAADQTLQGGSRNLKADSQFADGDVARFQVELLKELAGMGWVV